MQRAFGRALGRDVAADRQHQAAFAPQGRAPAHIVVLAGLVAHAHVDQFGRRTGRQPRQFQPHLGAVVRMHQVEISHLAKFLARS